MKKEKIKKTYKYRIVDANTMKTRFKTDSIGELMGEITGCKSFGECFMEKKVDNKSKPTKKKNR